MVEKLTFFIVGIILNVLYTYTNVCVDHWYICVLIAYIVYTVAIVCCKHHLVSYREVKVLDGTMSIISEESAVGEAVSYVVMHIVTNAHFHADA